MKKIIGTLIILSMVLFSTSLYAADGDPITVSGDAAAGGDLTFNPSPSTSMDTVTTDTAYNVTSWSIKNIGEDAGMQYFVTSSENGVFQAVLGDAAVTVGVAGVTGATWVQKQ